MKKSTLFWGAILLIFWSIGTLSLITRGIHDPIESYQDVLALIICVIVNILVFGLLLFEGIPRFNKWLDK